jgi:hypothetical protein
MVYTTHTKNSPQQQKGNKYVQEDKLTGVWLQRQSAASRTQLLHAYYYLFC